MLQIVLQKCFHHVVTSIELITLVDHRAALDDEATRLIQRNVSHCNQSTLAKVSQSSSSGAIGKIRKANAEREKALTAPLANQVPNRDKSPLPTRTRPTQVTMPKVLACVLYKNGCSIYCFSYFIYYHPIFTFRLGHDFTGFLRLGLNYTK